MKEDKMQQKILKLTDTHPGMTYEREFFDICIINSVNEAEKITTKLNEILSSINTETSCERIQKEIEELFGKELLRLIEINVPFENIISGIKISKNYSTTSYEFYFEDYSPLPVFELPDTEYWNVIKKLDEMINEEIDEMLEQPISEEYFWEVIAKMDYVSDFDYKRIRNTFKDEITKEFNDQYNKIYSQLENRIDEMLENEGLSGYEDLINLGDDSFGDMIAHIIGLGKDEYEKCMLNIHEVSAHAQGKFGTKEGYSESFEYILLN